MSVTKMSDKTYSEKKGCLKDDPCFGYLQIYYTKNPFLYVTTPPMKSLFGIEKTGYNNFQMNLQFTDKDTNPEMKHFYEFIENSEYECMRHLELGGEEDQRYVSQIKHDKKGKYDPNLRVKLPFHYNKFETDIYSDTRSGINLLQLPSFVMVQCDIYLDKIWRMNDKFYGKWKCRCIHLLE